MIVLYINWLVRKGFAGFALFPFIVFKDKASNNYKTLNHENIHIRQQLEMFVIPFFIWYFVEYIIRRIQFGSWKAAYYNISFESEAFANDDDLEYLKKRKYYSWIKYLKT